MCSYNQINNSYGCSNSYTLNHLLKNELNFQGFVMSDWQAQHSGVGTALAGLDMSMPGDTVFDSGLTFWGTNLTIAVLNGTIPEWRMDDMATRIMAAYYYVGRDTHYVPTNFYAVSIPPREYTQQADRSIVEHQHNRQDPCCGPEFSTWPC
jgi:beta-glucosidase